MGIHGLTSFIEENPDLLQDFRLHDTKVVIDGNNLYHQVYYHYHVPHQFNGDYDQFSLKLRQFFGNLKACNISPIIVFDGGYETDDRKLRTSLERARNRLHLAGFLSHGARGKILPILAYETFKHVLIELEIPHVTCDFEADSEIVVLANDLGCPVISLDSDFFILEVKGGYIPFNSMNLSVQTDNSSENPLKYLSTRIYFTDNFVKKFPSSNKLVLPLIATLLGNDFISEKSLEEFYSKLKAPRALCLNFFVPKTHTRMNSILNWLNQVDNIDDAVEKILIAGKMEKRDSLKRLLNKSLAAFSERKTYFSFNLLEFLSDSGSDNTEISSFHSYHGTPLPRWFCLAHRRAQIPVSILNAVLLHRIIFLSQVEDMQETSSFHCAVKLRQIIYGVLIKGDDVLDEDEMEAPSKKTHIEEYGREIKNIKKTLVSTLTEVCGYGCLPGLDDVPSLVLSDKILLLSHSLEVQSLISAPIADSLKLVTGSIVFWIKHAGPKITKNHLKTLLVCILILNIKQFENKENSNNCIMDTIQKSNPKHLQMVQASLRKYFMKQEHKRNTGIEVKIIHAFAQFQSCLIAAMHLNQLLGCPLPDPNPSLFFNGTFLYHFCRDLNTRPNVDLFIAEMLVKSSPLVVFYNFWLSWILENVQEDNFLEIRSYGSKRKKKRKDKRDNKTDEQNDDGDDDDSDEFKGKDSKLTLKAACSLTNRFQFLDLEEGV